jgi:uncharacterized phage-like protein YoqJ
MTIAVTGHRDIVIDDLLIAKVDAFFTQMLEEHGTIVLLSALAEGADQLVATSALKHENVRLEVPLPFEQEQYLKTFKHQDNFLTLQKEAKHTFVVPKVCEHPYENLGDYLVDHSDVLLALWDGTYNAKQGGTSDVVAYAESKNHTVVLILSKRQNN